MSEHEITAPVARVSRHGSGLLSAMTPLRLAWALVSCAITVLLMWLILVDDPLGGQPVAHLTLPPQNGSAALPGTQDDVVFRDGLQPEDERDIVPVETAQSEPMEPVEEEIQPLDAQFDALAEAQTDTHTPLFAAPVDGLTEPGAHGPLPRISAAGETPAQIYARPMAPMASDPNHAKIAIMVSGLGLSASGTSLAINSLPQEITLAFAPYAQGLQDWVDRARQGGHEVMLQIPMEPFDYPDNDPGPHTLLTTLAPQENVRRLEWLLSRVTGYFGITNYMGAKFTSAPDAVRTVLHQINLRGLAYVEDGASARSSSNQVARQLGLKATAADLVIDTLPNADAIDTALQQLETLALERGVALGVATGLPVTVERMAEWAKTLEAKGIILVPVSGART
jgi:polysaccharide deacetylase 2 family uncharacterized protein YibQ